MVISIIIIIIHYAMKCVVAGSTMSIHTRSLRAVLPIPIQHKQHAISVWKTKAINFAFNE